MKEKIFQQGIFGYLSLIVISTSFLPKYLQIFTLNLDLTYTFLIYPGIKELTQICGAS